MVSVAWGEAKDTTNVNNEPVVESNNDTIIVGVSGGFSH